MDREVNLDSIRADAARPYNVSPDVHAEDMIWRFISNHRNYPTVELAARYYFSDGAESARNLDAIIRRHLIRNDSDRRVSVFEFASGYGMVTRHLTQIPTQTKVVACDIHPEAVEFIRHRLGQQAVISQHAPEEVTFDELFDVVFALSFFSHMPEATFAKWLKTLLRAVKPNGILVFTTHGLISRQYLGNVTLSDEGFWFRPSSEQADLDPNEYGSSLATPRFVINRLNDLPGASLAEFQRGFWWGHQDLYVVTRVEDIE